MSTNSFFLRNGHTCNSCCSNVLYHIDTAFLWLHQLEKKKILLFTCISLGNVFATFADTFIFLHIWFLIHVCFVKMLQQDNLMDLDPTAWEALPSEIIEMILSWLSIFILIRFTIVSKHWFNVLHSPSFLSLW